MTEGETTRLVAWSRETRRVHERLRAALRVTRASADEQAARELLVFCRAFCTALTGHHEGEDHVLFPALEAAHPELRDTLRQLAHDHSVIGHLLGDLQATLDRAASPAELDRHLEGIAAIMESHFRFEERRLLTVLETLDLDAEIDTVFGPL
ncbi:hemerythrin domain-containing protein [Pseudonocardia sp. ICBG601]|uniref:hemerythrin domain-containing protein n=1 Tax=Pseudonocardia sp. ICBG601 TaxID=2846759 RepID=UPI001CF6E315|nr:hemerythrin domain-containing protein [Pseudonocardia sp. ICBG601]